MAASNAEMPARVRSVKDAKCTKVVTKYDLVKYHSLNSAATLSGRIEFCKPKPEKEDLVGENWNKAHGEGCSEGVRPG